MVDDPAATPGTKQAQGRGTHLSAMAERRAHFQYLYDFTLGHGLEIGPLDAGIADPVRCDVAFVDVFDKDGLRRHYAEDPNVFTELIPDIDFPLIQEGVTQTLAEVAKPLAPYDWIIASHVIEHVPDLVGWLQETSALTVPGGALVLAVPDRRYSFDRLRPPTTVGQALEAHEREEQRPSTRAIYDHVTSYVPVDTAALWRGARPPSRAPLSERLPEAMRQVERGRAGEYVDCHVWMFTPESFAQQLVELRSLGLTDWYIDTLLPVVGGIEFHVVLRRVPTGERPEQWGFSESPIPLSLPDWLSDEWTARDQVRRLQRQVKRLRRRNRGLRARRDELERSAAMRIGRGLLRPASAVRRLARRAQSRAT